MNRLFLAVASVCLTAACDRSPPASALLSCAGDEDCPSGFVCRASLGVCFDVDQLDNEPPSIVSASLDAPASTIGDAVTIHFAASERLALTPVVRIGTTRFTVTAEGNDGAHFIAKLTVTGALPEGAAAVVADLVDARGAAADNVAVATAVLDYTAPSRQGDAVISASAAGLRATFALSEPLEGPPGVSLTANDGTVTAVAAEADDASGLSFTASLSGAALPDDGRYAVSVDAVDVAGNQAFLGLGDVVVDTTAPAVLNGALAITRPPNSPLILPSALAGGGRATLSFSTSEPVATVDLSPTSCAADLDVAVAAGGRGASFFVFNVTAVAHGVTVTCPLLARLTDEAGNISVATPIVDSSGTAIVLVIDDVAPEASAISASSLKLLRVPFGAAQTNGIPMTAVVPASLETDAPVDASANLAPSILDDGIVLLRAQARTGAVLGQSERVGASFPPIILSLSDAPAVSLVAIDVAGNVGPVVDVNLAEWVATTRGKRPGSTFENPTRVDVVSRLGLSLEQGDAREASAPELELLDSGQLDIEAHPAFVDVSDDGRSPTGRSGTAVTWDAWRDEMVVFGGSGGVLFDETWLWGENQWTQASPRASPPPRFLSALAFDPRRGVSVLFGGNSAAGRVLGDVWEWTGTDWQERADVPAPPARRNLGMAFDPTTQRVVVFGGFLPGTGTLGDTWFFDGESWTEGPSIARGDVAPEPRFRPALLTLPDEGVLLVGGSDGAGLDQFVYDDTWLLHDGAWTQLDVGHAPAVVSGRLFLDPVTKRPALFGGLRSDLTTRSDEIVSLDEDGVWRVTGIGPFAVSEATLAVDPSVGPIVTGGTDSNFIGPASIWWLHPDGPRELTPTAAVSTSGGSSGSAGVLAASVGAPGIAHRALGLNTTPLDGRSIPVSPAQGGVGFVTSTPRMVVARDESRDLTVAVVVSVEAGVSTERTFELRGESFVAVGAPVQVNRGWSGVVFDEGRDALVGFGTTNFRSSLLDGNGVARIYEGNGVWRDLTDAVEAPIDSAAIAYDRARQEIVAFGGRQFIDFSNFGTARTWTLSSTSTTWVEQTPVVAPSPRFHTTMTWDDDRQRVVLFGGERVVQGRFVHNAETWEWDGTDWTLAATGPMSAREGMQLLPDAAFAAPVLRGGFALFSTPQVDFPETWVWRSGARDRPALLWTLPVAAQIGGASRSLSWQASAVVAGVGGAVGDSNAVVPGADVLVFSAAHGTWVETGTTSADVAAERIVAAGDASTLLADGTLRIAIAPRASRGAAAGNRVNVAQLELRVRYSQDGSAVPAFEGSRPEIGPPVVGFGARVDECEVDGDCGVGNLCEFGACKDGCQPNTCGFPFVSRCFAGTCRDFCGPGGTSCDDGGELCGTSALCVPDCRLDPTFCGECCNQLTGFCGFETLNSSETWSFDGTSFAQLNATSNNFVERTGGAAARASSTSPLVIAFGGAPGRGDPTSVLQRTPADDDWQFAPGGDEPPAGTDGAHAVFLDNDRVLVIEGELPFSGLAGPFATWIYNPTLGTWRHLTSGVQPPPRSGAMVASDPTGRALLYGGFDATPTPIDDLWAFNPTTESWQQLTVVGAARPAPRGLAGMATARNGAILLQGGIDALGTVLQDAWLLTIQNGNKATWSLQPGVTIPRAEQTLVADPAGGFLSVGGIDDSRDVTLNFPYFRMTATAPVGVVLEDFLVAPAARARPIAVFDGTRVLIGAGRLQSSRCQPQ